MYFKENCSDLDSSDYIIKGGGGDATHITIENLPIKAKNHELNTSADRIMSVCFEPSNVLTSTVSTTASSETSLDDHVTTQPPTSVMNQTATVTTNIVQPFVSNKIQSSTDQSEQIISSTKSIAKLVVANASGNPSPVLQKVVNPPLITVLNPSGPLTVVKTLCVTSGVSSTPQFTLVNSAPLNVTNTVGKSPTITLLNSPVTVVKAITASQNINVERNLTEATNNAATTSTTSPISTIIENRAHNVFVKNTCPDSTVLDMPQSHKILTANNFPQANIIKPQSKTLNGQRNKLKIVSSNMIVPGTSQTANNILVNKSNQRYIPRQKVLGPNGATTKYLNKSTPNYVKPGITPSPTRMVYPTHKNQIKTLSPVQNYIQKYQQSVKNIAHKGVPGQVTRTGSGLRTISPQKAHKMPSKPNYIGKHAVQSQKMRQAHGKGKGLKVPQSVSYNVHVPPMPTPDKHLNELTFNQALTAQIIETLSNTSSSLQNNRYDLIPTRYDNAFTCPEIKPTGESFIKQVDDGNKSGLDTLSLICQAVLLDHNYNATLPPDSPPRPSASPLNLSTHSQVNGLTSPSIYSPGSSKRRQLPSTSTSSPVIIPTMSAGPINNPLLPDKEDDAASDISDVSERKIDTEGEETDTAPEAEAVTNENFDGYGDYVTRCICGFLHDDGYMVECDKCKVWQHVQCVVKNKQVPDEYLCEECDLTKPIDRQKARGIQQQWLRDRQLLDPKLRKEPKIKEVFKSKEAISDSDSSDDEPMPNNFIPKTRLLASKRKTEGNLKQTLTKKRENAKEVVQKRQKRKERKIIRKKTKPTIKNQSDDENQDTWASHLPQLRQWIEKYEEAVTNHYSPELRARISSIRVNGVHSDSNIQYDSTVQKCRVHTQPLTEIKYIVATVNLVPSTVVVELRGKYMLSAQHRNSGGSLTTRQHSQRPGPFLFFYRLHKDNTEICVDTRTYGNSARFIRRSCKPNAELRHCFEKGVLHIYVVSTASVDKNVELTIKHESHDLAAVGTTSIACACGNLDECAVNKLPVKKNGETAEVPGRKRRRRRIMALNPPVTDPPKPVKEPPPLPSPPLSPPSPVKLKTEKPEPEEVKEEIFEEPIPEVKKEEEPTVEVKVEEVVMEEQPIVKTEEEPENLVEMKEVKDEKPPMEEDVKSPTSTPVTTRRSSHKSDKEEEKFVPKKEDKKEKSKKLSREERKLEAILRAIEQMEKAESKKQEHQAKQAHRRESEPNPAQKDEEKPEPKFRRRRRKGRARTVSQSTAASRRNRLNSTDSYMTTSGEENLLSPHDSQSPVKSWVKNTNSNSNKAIGLLLALSNGDNDNKDQKSPARETDSNSMHSSPETPLSSACLLVQAAVEPLEQGFKFPKTKKGLMNEWLNKTPESAQSASAISPTSLDSPGIYGSKNGNSAQMVPYSDASVQPRGSAKKRWLRQAIREDHSCDSQSGRPDSPPISDMVAPPKKRRLPRESISTDNSPPTTPTGPTPSLLNNLDKELKKPEGSVEIVYTGTEGDSPNQSLESEAVLKERAAKMKQEFGKHLFSSSLEHQRSDLVSSVSMSMDPRLSRERFLPHTDLVGAVEKTLSILGLENKPDPPTPKRKVKLSITEYRQRKKQNVEEEKFEEQEQEPELVSTEENNSSDSFKAARRLTSRSASSSTSITSSDEESEIVVKAPVFNSEPTELERQRETSSLRFKKGFELTFDREPPAAIKAILNLELETTKAKSASELSPTSSTNGNVEPAAQDTDPVSKDEEPETRADSPPPDEKSEEIIETPTEKMETEQAPDSPKETSIAEKKSDDQSDSSSNLFYTPDEEDSAVNLTEKEETRAGFEEESLSYVPPFNNPIYPNSSFTHFSTADDDARYEGRNPSPPPDLDEFTQS